MLKNKIICFFMALITALSPLQASAIDLDNAFGALLGPGAAAHINKPGRYQSGARNGFTGGGVDVRIPKPGNAPALFSISMPRIQAGCNGISAHFGGFSFISGKEFEMLLKQIASGAALGFVTSLVMKMLCAPCEEIVATLRAAAQLAARLAKDSCQIGRNLASQFMSGLGSDSGGDSRCAVTSAAQGGSADPLMSFQSLCNTLDGVSSTLKGWNQDLTNLLPGGTGSTAAIKAAKDEQVDCNLGNGNMTWRFLTTFDNKNSSDSSDNNEAYHRKLMLINIMGAKMRYAGNDSQVGCDHKDGTNTVLSEGSPELYCTPTISGPDVVKYFMCGSPANAQNTTSQRIKSICSEIYRIPTGGTSGGSVASTDTTHQAWQCRGGDSDKSTCKYLELKDAGEVFQGKGFLLSVNELLRDGVRRVRENKSMDTVENGIDGKQILALMQVAPYPLYQAINAAAVYPAAADDLVDTLSVMVSEQFAYAMLDDLLKIEGRSSTNTGKCVTKEMADKMLEFITSLRQLNFARSQQIANNFAVQQGLTEQIRQINIAIQRQVLSGDMLSTGKMSETLNRAVSPSTGAAPAQPTTP